MNRLDRLYQKALKGVHDREQREGIILAARVVAAYFEILSYYYDKGEEVPEFESEAGESFFRNILDSGAYGVTYEEMKRYFSIPQNPCSIVIPEEMEEYFKEVLEYGG